MKNTHTNTLPRAAGRALLAAALGLFALAAPASAQTAATTVISNTATATYKDTSNNDYETKSNTVTVTVAEVSGLAITPDGQANSGVVPGEPNVKFVFTVTNTGNFADSVRFLTSGGSVHLTGPGTVTAAVIDNGDGDIGPGDTDIFGNNSAPVDRALNQNQSATVIVHVTISAGASENDVVQVFLGDAAAGALNDYDNQAVDPSGPSLHEVRTVTAGTANGQREARGDIRVTVQKDVLLRAEMVSWPAGPVALGSDITYTTRLCNVGARDATAMSLGTNSGVYVVVPVPDNTQLSAANSFPAGTLYTTSLLNVAPESANWQTTAPTPLTDTRRVAFRVGNTLASGGACSANFQFIVTITATNASTPIYQIFDAFATNKVNVVLTDQSGDTDTNQGDRNANFNEPVQGGTDVAGQGFMVVTLLQQLGNVLIGPSGAPAAVGPGSSNNTDFTERSVNTGIAGVAPGGATTALGSVTFVNTVQNTGNANDTFTLSAPTVPAGFTVEISTAGLGGPYTDVSSGGTTTVAVNYGASANIHVRVTAPAGKTVLTAFATVVRATSGITSTNSNETIDRLFTGFIRLTKSASTMDSTGNPGPAIPGNHIEFVVTYENIMTAVVAGSGNSSLSAENLTITENGGTGGNNWATFTTQVVGSASDVNNGPNAGQIAGDAAASNVLTDTVSSLPAGASGTFRFKRRIN